MALDPKDRDRLEKLLNMLGSPNEGEIGNAGRMIKKVADRYNVTIATLCLGNPQPPREATDSPFSNDDIWRHDRDRDPFRGRGFNTRGHWGGRSWAEQEEQRQREAEGEARRRREEEYHRQREEALRREGERRAREQAKKDARKRRYFPGAYFGLLGRLKLIYDEQWGGLQPYELDFIETVLDQCKADRMMTRTQVHMAKAIIKQNEEAEPLV